MTQPSEGPPPADGRLGRSPRRWILAGLGLVCVGLGLLGVVLPGLPTTVFLLLASYLFARSCPVLEEKLLGLPVFRPYMRYARGEVAIPLRARLAALAMMWTAVTSSLLVLRSRELLAPWGAALLLAAAVVGTVAILRWRQAVPEAESRQRRR